jgi:DNA mismatch repair protein MutL
MCNISGFIGKPESARKKGAKQYFFVNGRYMKHPYFNKAVMNAFERLVPVGEQVPYFLYFDVNPEDIDVNIHPTKTEIKFENEQAIWQILFAAVKESVGVFNDVPSIDFDTEGKPDIPVYNPDVHSAAVPNVNYNPQYNPFSQPSASRKSDDVDQWEQLYQGLEQNTPQKEEDIFQSSEVEMSMGSTQSEIEEKSPAHYQYKGKYIMTAVKSGLMVIDQHRAHIRILYEQYLEQLASHQVQSQKVLYPEVIQFAASDQVMLEKILPEMEELGFELTDLGGGSCAINAIPSGLEGLNMVDLVNEMVTAAIEKGTTVKDEINQSLALSLARNAAIPQGQVLSNLEMEGIVDGLFACSNVNYTPDGKKIFYLLPQDEIDRNLG